MFVCSFPADASSPVPSCDCEHSLLKMSLVQSRRFWNILTRRFWIIRIVLPLLVFPTTDRQASFQSSSGTYIDFTFEFVSHLHSPHLTDEMTQLYGLVFIYLLTHPPTPSEQIQTPDKANETKDSLLSPLKSEGVHVYLCVCVCVHGCV